MKCSGFAQSFGQMVSVRLLTCVAQLHTVYLLFSLGKSLQLVRSLIGSHERAARVRFVNHKYDFSQKFQDTAFNYDFIRSILKSHKLIQPFSRYQPL